MADIYHRCEELTLLAGYTGVYLCKECRKLWILPPAFTVENIQDILAAACQAQHDAPEKK